MFWALEVVGKQICMHSFIEILAIEQTICEPYADVVGLKQVLIKYPW
jgi:hypothetical protein